MSSNLMKIANQFRSKLETSTGAQKTKTAEIKKEAIVLPKSLQKLAKAEEKLNRKIAECREKFNKVASGPSVQYSGGPLQALYHVCTRCQGLGKVTASVSNQGIKFASTEAYLSSLKVEKCGACNGKRVVKSVDENQCTQEQLMRYAAEEVEKEEKKKDKKSKKAAKKLSKLEQKAEEKRLAVEDPEKAAAMKVERKKAKSDKKAKKGAAKAEKKLNKFKSKKFPFFAKKEE
jgi:hypothetical protein